MVFDPRIAHLLLRWEELRAQGQILSPEELCRDCPDLLSEIVKGLHGLETTCHSLDSTPQHSEVTLQPNPGQIAIPAVENYKILGILGQGGMGIVYQAWSLKQQKIVALKTLQRVTAATIYRLKQEFRALADVTHPNLVGLYELVSTGQQYFVAMELIEGEHFLANFRPDSDAIDSRSLDVCQAALTDAATIDIPIPSSSRSLRCLSRQQYDRLRDTLRQLAQGVSALHAHGKLHRDIKPSNVMVTREGRVVLLDFGLVADMDWDGLHQSTDQNVTGTVAYMSPEQAASQAQSEASDWYSVGVVLYEALTGQLPFTGPPLRVLMDKQQREPVAPNTLVPDIPEDLNQLCIDLLRTSVDARPIGSEILRRLDSVTSREETSIARPSMQGQRASLVGREDQLAELHAAFRSMSNGRTTVVRLQGRSGAGKSLLAQHFLEELRQQGEPVILAGKCYERESVPYKALDNLIDSLSRHLRHLSPLEAQAVLPREPQLLAQVFPVLQRVTAIAESPSRAGEVVDPHELRRRAFAALRELLARIGDRKPLVLLIDDLQWGDVDGATQLVELLRQPDAPVLMLVACFRSEDADTSPCLEILNRAIEKAGTALDQRPLSVDQLGLAEARELALNLLGRRDAASLAQAETIASESGGNPFFVQVLAECVASNVQVAANTSDSGTLPLDEILWSRIQTLRDEPRRLLEVIAVSGQPLRLYDARQAAELRLDEHGTLAALRSARLLRSSGFGDGQELETWHDRIRETILSHLPLDIVKNLHHRIAAVLELAVRNENHKDINAVSETSLAATTTFEDAAAVCLNEQFSKRVFDLVYHFDVAGDSMQALPYAVAMADQARAQYALEIAERLYRIAERGAEMADHATQYKIAENLGDILMLRGRYPDAAIRFQSALVWTSDILKRAQVEGKLGELAFKQGDIGQAIKASENALELLGRKVPRSAFLLHVHLLRELSIQLLHTMFPAWFLARQPLESVEQQLLNIRLDNRLCYAYWFGRGKTPCLWIQLRAMNLAECYPPTRELARAYSIHTPVMSLLAFFDRGITYAQHARNIYKNLGDLQGEGTALHYNGLVLYVAARYEECIEKCGEAVQILERAGDVWEENIARYHVAASHYRLGNLATAAAEAKHVYQSGIEIGDIQASGIALDLLVRATGKISAEALEIELEHVRYDVQGTAQVKLAGGVRLLMLDRPAEAAAFLGSSLQDVEKTDVKNAWTFPLRTWLASALRREAEKAAELTPEDRRKLLNRAWNVAKKAVKIARTFQTELPHALRECGLIAAEFGQIRKSRRFFDESLAVAVRQGAKFEHAQTLHARGRIGKLHNWPDAQQDLVNARQALTNLGGNFCLPDESVP